MWRQNAALPRFWLSLNRRGNGKSTGSIFKQEKAKGLLRQPFAIHGARQRRSLKGFRTFSAGLHPVWRPELRGEPIIEIIPMNSDFSAGLRGYRRKKWQYRRINKNLLHGFTRKHW